MATTTNYGWTTPNDTDLVKDGAAAIRTLGSSVDTTTKALNPSTTLGDIEYRSATANTNTRLGIGTTGQVLTVASGVPSWATPAGGGGKVLQVVNASTTTGAYTSSSTYIDTNLTASITPSSATSKVLIFVCQEGVNKNAVNSNANATLRLLRNSTSILEPIGAYIAFTNTTVSQSDNSSCTYLDSPATTSSITYKTQIKSTLNTDGVYAQDNGAQSTITLMEIGA